MGWTHLTTLDKDTLTLFGHERLFGQIFLFRCFIIKLVTNRFDGVLSLNRDWFFYTIN